MSSHAPSHGADGADSAAGLDTASWGRRMLALLVDWLASVLVVLLFLGTERYVDDAASGFYVLGVFVVQSAALTALIGGSFGKVATRLRVIRGPGDPRPPTLISALLRQVMVALVIPPLVFRPDGRGLHDVLTGSATVRLQTHRAMVAG